MLTMAEVADDVARLRGMVGGGREASAPAVPEIAAAPEIVVPEGGVAASAFDVDRLLASSMAYAASSIAGLGGRAVVERIDLAHLLAFCTTHVAVDGAQLPAWADLSGVYATRDGRHLQLHCNFPHHADGVVRHLGCAPDRDHLAAAIAERDAADLEGELIDAGMIAAMVRTLDEWSRHPHAVATASLPVISVERVGDAPPEPLRTSGPGHGDDVLAGVRVADWSRVLAGPVAGQLLAGLGADVVRVGADHLPTVPICVTSTGFGKRWTSIDLRGDDGVDTALGLLSGADVWLDAFRPGALAARGLDLHRVLAARPGLVVVQVSAFDWDGPWAGRRGFDSIVQSTTGIRWAGGEFARGERGPLGLPVQALDYATGFLAAGVAAQLLERRRAEGGSWLARLSLLRTRNWLGSMGGPHAFDPRTVDVADDHLDQLAGDVGMITAVRPVVGRWPSPPPSSPDAAPRWRG